MRARRVLPRAEDQRRRLRGPRPRGARARWGCVRGLFALWITLATLVSPPGLRAQAPRWELELSGSRVAFDTTGSMNAPSASVLAEWAASEWVGRGSMGVTGFQDAGWSVQGRGEVAGRFSPFGPRRPVRFELSGSAAGSRHSLDLQTGMARTDARLLLLGGRSTTGLWAGVGLGTSRNSFDTAAVRSVVPGVGAWLQRASVRATFSYAVPRVLGATHPEANVALATTRGPLDLTLYGGYRWTPFETEDDERWAGFGAALWLDARAALTVAGGRYAADLLQGLPGGSFLSVGVRLTPRRGRPVPASVSAPLVYTAEVARDGGISFQVDGASRVEIAGDWNGWQPHSLERDASGRWRVPSGLAPGVYRFNLRVDGDRWVVPDEVPSADDGFGGRVGMLVIAEAAPAM